jgi:hypothetical protein
MIYTPFSSIEYEDKGLVHGITKALVELYENFSLQVPTDTNIKGLLIRFYALNKNKYVLF